MEQLPNSFDELCEALATLQTPTTSPRSCATCARSPSSRPSATAWPWRALVDQRHALRRDRAPRRRLHHHRHPRGPLAAPRQRRLPDRARPPLRVAPDAAAADRPAVEGAPRRAGRAAAARRRRSSFEPTAAACACRCPTTTLELLFARADDIPVLGRRPGGRLRHRRARTRSPSRASSWTSCSARLRALPARVAAPAARRSATRATSPACASRPRTRATVGRYLAGARRRGDLIPITGSVELAPSLDAAEAIADLVSSGETLRQNGLVELETILESEAVLLAPADLDPASRPARRRARAGARVRARRAPEALPDAERARRPR